MQNVLSHVSNRPFHLNGKRKKIQFSAFGLWRLLHRPKQRRHSWRVLLTFCKSWSDLVWYFRLRPKFVVVVVVLLYGLVCTRLQHSTNIKSCIASRWKSNMDNKILLLLKWSLQNFWSQTKSLRLWSQRKIKWPNVQSLTMALENYINSPTRTGN